jgi:hypothetical protein
LRSNFSFAMFSSHMLWSLLTGFKYFSSLRNLERIAGIEPAP